MFNWLLAWLMPKKANRVFKVLDRVMVSMDREEAAKMWKLFFALTEADLQAPPNIGKFTIERNTVGLIRTVLFPLCYSKKEYIRIMRMEGHLHDMPMMTQNHPGIYEDMVETINTLRSRIEWDGYRIRIMNAVGSHHELAKNWNEAFNAVMNRQLDKLAEESKEVQN